MIVRIEKNLEILYLEILLNLVYHDLFLSLDIGVVGDLNFRTLLAFLILHNT